MRPSTERSERDQLVTIFDALSEPLRLEIVAKAARTDELACVDLERDLPVTKSTISYHVKILSHAGLLDVRKGGRNYFYTLRRDVLDFYVPQLSRRLSESDEATVA